MLGAASAPRFARPTEPRPHRLPTHHPDRMTATSRPGEFDVQRSERRRDPALEHSVTPSRSASPTARGSTSATTRRPAPPDRRVRAKRSAPRCSKVSKLWNFVTLASDEWTGLGPAGAVTAPVRETERREPPPTRCSTRATRHSAWNTDESLGNVESRDSRFSSKSAVSPNVPLAAGPSTRRPCSAQCGHDEVAMPVRRDADDQWAHPAPRRPVRHPRRTVRGASRRNLRRPHARINRRARMPKLRPAMGVVGPLGRRTDRLFT